MGLLRPVFFVNNIKKPKLAPLVREIRKLVIYKINTATGGYRN